ncbi:MAG TPA: hypothetical protein VFY83_07575 [Anaerolineales bacterium]|nr:hypothetical protein [Anaerolineales bacterium]
MKKLVLLVFSFALPLVLGNACASLPLPLIPTPTAEPTATPQTSHPPIPVRVPRFYDSEDLQIRVGEYSQELGTQDLQELTVLAKEMGQQKDELTPEQMFVLAIRLYDLGEKDDSVYWFYEAQFRAKLFLTSLDAHHRAEISELTAGLLASYDAFTQLAGEHINGYAGCDVDNWVRIAKTVKDDNPTPPALDKLFPEAVFVEPSKWQEVNDQVAAGLGVLIDQLSQTKEVIRLEREANNLDAQYCS